MGPVHPEERTSNKDAMTQKELYTKWKGCRGVVRPLCRAMALLNMADTPEKPDWNPDWASSDNAYGYTQAALYQIIKDVFGVDMREHDNNWLCHEYDSASNLLELLKSILVTEKSVTRRTRVL